MLSVMRSLGRNGATQLRAVFPPDFAAGLFHQLQMDRT